MLSFMEGNKKFNFRVGAIILNKQKTKILLHTIKGYDFYLLPGGSVEWRDSCEQAIKRELKEELNLDDFIVKPRLFLENFFIFKGVEYQEISHNFILQLNAKHAWLEKEEEFFGVEGEKYIYKWVELKDIKKYVLKPAILKDVIENWDKGYEYQIIDER